MDTLTPDRTRRWLRACREALDDADYLAGRLGRLVGGQNGDLRALQIRIAALRAEMDEIFQEAPSAGGDDRIGERQRPPPWPQR